MQRCNLNTSDPLYIHYHDQEWGVSVFDDRKQFEFLLLESAQAGLSWITILKKRENYRQAFANFQPEIVATFDDNKLEKLRQNSGIIRNGRKIRAAVNNANRFLEIQREFGSFCNYLWGFVDFKPVVNRWKTTREIPAETELSRVISKDMKSRGFQFLGPIIIYSHLQATGLVNDHVLNCFRWKQCQEIFSQFNSIK
ncbi:MAG: DNA-3-methyladenine glycosylase I [Candidatus Cloacimonadota bacterium]|nr:DNA-3-methyladenine glycosylase I [Candidatus Cloacimonadota bacterium]